MLGTLVGRVTIYIGVRPKDSLVAGKLLSSGAIYY